MAKCVIETWNVHLILNLCTVDLLFPLHLWCQLLVQIDLILNQLCAFNLHPQLSVYYTLFGQFDLNLILIIPTSNCVMIHEISNQQKSFGVKELKGWYIGPAPNYYRYYNIFLNKTNGTKIGDSVEF